MFLPGLCRTSMINPSRPQIAFGTKDDRVAVHNRIVIVAEIILTTDFSHVISEFRAPRLTIILAKYLPVLAVFEAGTGLTRPESPIGPKCRPKLPATHRRALAQRFIACRTEFAHGILICGATDIEARWNFRDSGNKVRSPRMVYCLEFESTACSVVDGRWSMTKRKSRQRKKHRPLAAPSKSRTPAVHSSCVRSPHSGGSFIWIVAMNESRRLQRTTLLHVGRKSQFHRRIGILPLFSFRFG